MPLPQDGHFPLGCLEAPLSACEEFPVYGDVPDQPMRTREQIMDMVGADPGDLGPDAADGYVHDQNGYGMCTNSATAGAMEDTAIMQGGVLVKLSAGDLYQRSGGGRDSGSTLTAALREAMIGVAPVSVRKYLDWQSRPTQEVVESRKLHRILEAFWAPTALHYFSGLLEGFRGVCGISWGSFKPDGDGWLPRPGGGGGHALMSYGVALRHGKLGAKTRNSWKPTWGPKQGRCVIGEDHFRSHFGGMFLVRSVTDFGGIAVKR